MEKKRDYKREDRHRNSVMIGARVDLELAELFKAKAESVGKTRNAIIVEWIEDFVFGDED